MAAAKRSAGTTWSTDVPRELMEMILLRLDLVDHIRFGSVCKWWRSVAVDDNSPTAIKKPFRLVFSDDPQHLIHRLLTCIWPSWGTAKFIGGSDDGWLVVQMEGKDLFLFNPAATTPPVRLPPLPSPPVPTFFNKAVLSSPTPSYAPAGEHVIVLRHNYCMLYAYCLGKDTAWRLFYKGGTIIDITFYKDRLYAIDSEGRIFVFRSRLDPRPLPAPFPHLCSDYYHLVNATDKLLAVTYPRPAIPGQPVKSLSIPKVYELDPTNSSYIQAERIGDDKIVFVSRICSLVLSAKNYPEFRSNRLNEIHGAWYFDSYSLEKNKLESGYTKRSPIFFTLFDDEGFMRI